MLNPILKSFRSKRGLTLVELMIVVAVIGVLATIASVSFTKYVRQAKITKLKQYAMDVARGQEQFRARNNVYLPRKDGEILKLDSTTEDTDKKTWTQLLEFNHQLEAGVTIETESGIGAGCDICGGVDPTFKDDTHELAWYAVRVSQAMKTENAGKGAAEITSVILTSDLLQPVVLREGE